MCVKTDLKSAGKKGKLCVWLGGKGVSTKEKIGSLRLHVSTAVLV